MEGKERNKKICKVVAIVAIVAVRCDSLSIHCRGTTTKDGLLSLDSEDDERNNVRKVCTLDLFDVLRLSWGVCADKL